MHCVTWVYPPQTTMTKADIDELFGNVADMYVGVSGLIQKSFGYSEDGRTVVGIYLWKSKADADAFYTPDWTAGVTRRWGGMPTRTDWEIPQIVNSQDGSVMREKSLEPAQ